MKSHFEKEMYKKQKEAKRVDYVACNKTPVRLQLDDLLYSVETMFMLLGERFRVERSQTGLDVYKRTQVGMVQRSAGKTSTWSRYVEFEPTFFYIKRLDRSKMLEIHVVDIEISSATREFAKPQQGVYLTERGKSWFHGNILVVGTPYATFTITNLEKALRNKVLAGLVGSILDDITRTLEAA